MHEASEHEIRQRIEATRARMGDTIEEIGDRVNPDRLQREFKARAREQVDDFKDTVKQKARDRMHDMEDEVKSKGRGLWNTIRENPIPAGMVGVGLAWLMTNRSSDDEDAYSRRMRERSDPRYRAYPGHGYDPGHPDSATIGYRAGYMTARAQPGSDYGPSRDDPGSEGMMDRAREGAEHTMERAREGAEHTAERVREGAHDAAEAVRDKGSELADRASEGFEDARHRVEHWADEAQQKARRVEHRVEGAVREHPLAAGMVAAALGFAAGLMIPETDKEHELMGPTRDRMLDRAHETASRASDKAKEVVRETAGRSAERAVDEMWSGHSDEDRAPMTDPGR